MTRLTFLQALEQLRDRGYTHVVDDFESDHEVTPIADEIAHARTLRAHQLGGVPIWEVRGADIYDGPAEPWILDGEEIPETPYRKGVVLPRLTVWDHLMSDDDDPSDVVREAL